MIRPPPHDLSVLSDLALLLSRTNRHARSTTAPGYHRYRGTVVFPDGLPSFHSTGPGRPVPISFFLVASICDMSPEPDSLRPGPHRIHSGTGRGLFSSRYRFAPGPPARTRTGIIQNLDG